MLILDLATPSPCYRLQQALYQVWWVSPQLITETQSLQKFLFSPPTAHENTVFPNQPENEKLWPRQSCI